MAYRPQSLKEYRVSWPTLIVFHCSDTEDGPGNDVEAIRKYHIERNGWADIGYHFVIEKRNNVYVMVPGREPQAIGAHAVGYNHNSIGVCIVGKYDMNVPDSAFSAAVQGLAHVCWTYGLPAGAIRGHRELPEHATKKTCPGLAWDLNRLRRHVEVYLDRLRKEGLRLSS